MIVASFFKSDVHFAGFIVSGHAEFSKKNNRDIVCACVSSAVQMAVNTITDIVCAEADTKVEDDTIVLLLSQNITSQQQQICDIILKGLQLQIKFLSEDFKGFVKLEP